MSNKLEKEVIMINTIIFLGLKIFLSVEAAPNTNLKSWNDGDLSPLIPPPCSTNEPCWNWFPVVDSPGSPYILQEDTEVRTPRIQTIRRADSDLISWHGNTDKVGTIDRISIPVSSQFPNRLSKKDFLSRGWGAGGMPFSVLYMSPQYSRVNHGPTQVSNTGESIKSESPIKTSEIIPIPSKNTQQNYRVALRNGSSGQPRKQYSTIPQLFISYGWGPSGK